MGLFADRLAEIRNDPGWLTRGDNDEREISPSGVRVDRGSAMSISAFFACVDLISNAVGLAPTSVVVKIGSRSFPEYGPLPGWLTNPNPADPNYMASDYFAEATLSMLTDGNFFTAVSPHVMDPQVLTLLDPRRVQVKPGPLYELMDRAGRVVATLGPMQILHGWWQRMPGELRGVSPLESLRRSFGAAIAADDFAARYFGQGASLSFGVEVPTGLSEEQKENLQRSLRKRHAGLSNSHAIGVLTAGAKFVPGLAPTPEQSQMLETRKFAVEDVARVFGVPPGMIGSQEPGASSFASAVEWRKHFRDNAVLKFTTRLERQHARLLSLPVGITDPAAKAELVFNLDFVARTDMLARFQAYGEGIRQGFTTPNEVRHDEGKPPLDGGDLLYMQQQMVPLADLGKTKLTEPLPAQQPA